MKLKPISVFFILLFFVLSVGCIESREIKKENINNSDYIIILGDDIVVNASDSCFNCKNQNCPDYCLEK